MNSLFSPNTQVADEQAIAEALKSDDGDKAVKVAELLYPTFRKQTDATMKRITEFVEAK